MTSRFGEQPPRPEDSDSLDDLSTPSWMAPREGVSQSSLWEDPSSTPDDGNAGPAAPEVTPEAGEPPDDATSLDAPLDDEASSGPETAAETEGDTIDPEAAEVPVASSGVRARRVAWELVQTLVLAALIFLMVRGVAQNFRVEGPSMEPGLHNGQYLLVNKAVYFRLDLNTLSKYLPFVNAGSNPSRYLFHGPQRGDVIVFRYPRDPSRDFIKRIIGIPGDTVSIDNGVVSVNGTVLHEDYINPGATTTMEPKVVPVGNYFVMGDNRPNSSDSRSWGFVPEENIIGKAMFSYWPFSDFGGVGNTSINLGFVKIPVF
jgi:signal peptidase I